MPQREYRVQLTMPHAGQRRVRAAAKRFNTLAAGRRWGKSEIQVNIVAEPAIEGYPTALFAPTHKMLVPEWRALRSRLAPITRRANDTYHTIELVTGGVVDGWSLDNPDAGRGRKYKVVAINEAGLIAQLLECWEASIRPTLIDYKGGAWLCGTPKGRNGFFVLNQNGLDPKNEEWASFSLPSWDNPFVDRAEIEKLKKSVSERYYRQEILSEFIDDAGMVFRRVAEAATATEQKSAIAGHQYVQALDWGKQNDFTVHVVFDVTTREVAAVDRYNQVDYQLQLQRVKTLYHRFPGSPLIPERNSIGEPLIEQLKRMDIQVTPFVTTNATKAQAIETLALAFEQQTIKILPDAVMIGELQAYEGDKSKNGAMIYGAPEGMHDDCVMALAIAVNAASGNGSCGVLVL